MNEINGAYCPDAFHIGFSKCASTFLQAFFEEHAGVFLLNQSHDLAPFEFTGFPEGKQRYLELFGGAQSGQVRLESDEHIVLPLFHPVLGAAATTLESVAEVSLRMKSINPAAKIIVVVRNQAGLLVSRYSEYVLCGGKSSFDEFVSEFLCCSKDGVNYYQNHYAKILEILENDFSPDNVLMLLQEQLSRNEAETIERLSQFLAIEPIRPSKRGMASRRVGLSSLGIKVVRGMNRILVKQQKQSFNEARVRVPFLLYKVIQRGLRIIDFYLPKAIKGDKNAILTKEIRARIRSEFQGDNDKLGERLGTDLSEFGY